MNAFSSTGENGTGQSGAAIRFTGASRSSNASSAIVAAISPPKPPVRLSSCSTTTFEVLRTLSSTASLSHGITVRRSTISTETPFGKARIHREGDDVSVITWGAMVHTAEEAAKQLEADGISVEILDLRTLIPWDKQAVLQSVSKTSKVVVLHEDTQTGGFGGEIAATIAEEAFEDLDGPLKRIAAPDTPVPFSPTLEKAFIPQVDDVAKGIREVAEY